MRPRTIMAVGGHIGDMDLAAGPLLAQVVQDGGRAVLVALTPGERGHPRLSIDDYRRQKISEGEAFAAAIGADFHVFDDLSDGFLEPTDDVAGRLARLIRDVRPEMLIAHWKHSIHTDHEHASTVAERARFLAGLPGWAPEHGERHGVAQLLYAENWEDDRGFDADSYVPISEQAFATWHAAISGQAFARGETYGFRYIDYYTAQLTMRGCLARTDRAVALSTGDGSRVTVLD
ncbi:PIG-L deacetylase family protein [Phytoactinopolyspora halotolerans]|uniref:PIG-L family deacetylase n=1 Tax=Phytoactinopolyspora halotolerans TaxID=1981512 RepID=A0A6L9SD34_9ACTN|nr:PIG-L family deacetylase [Phytoactinopolyspora halotolerans]NEE03013.1 PIG-L family deacetylase [Phytoactinopolyspora halotolerans]